MRAIEIERVGAIRAAERDEPRPEPDQLLVRVSACGVCRTDLHLLDGEVEIPHPPIIPGHQIVGTVVEAGASARAARIPEPGTKVGIPWLGWTCGAAATAAATRENLCERARFTGRDIDGGYAELTVADHRYCFALPEG